MALLQCVASPSPPPPRPPPPAVTCLNDATKRCATCQAAPNQLRCATCATAGWTVNAAGVCVAPAQDPTACLATVANCHTCNNWYPSLCYQCNAGYLLRNNQCQPTASGWGTSWRNA
ncbi:serine threonine [Chlorella sorokiniana]|uniref:Serine threonine n=1 Tax=Chlorella sorokiniana TaxID=3076 RepID=A0A2P6TES8_CHLSO|nr:serine threonine [Chlorella sorokiniana]|eukprot:PRW32477.1 serine threonine [Chlorella sorokiniana]